MELWKKEFRSFIKSVVYILFVLLVVVFYCTQFGGKTFRDVKNAGKTSQFETPGDYDPLIKPLEGMKNYGSEYAEVPELIMPELISRLINDIELNKFATYKFGFYKGVTLSDSELEEARKIVSDCTGLEYYQAAQHRTSEMPIVCDYETFKAKMEDIENMIGSNSNYAYDSYRNIAQKPLTYEEAKEKYDVLIEKDKVSGAYARLFCDYMNIPALLFSVFAAVAFFMRDKRTGADETVYASGISSAKLIAVRYTVCVAALMLPFIILAALPSAILSVYGLSKGISIDHLAFLKYVLSWILPTVMISVSVGAALTILTGNYSGVVVWFFIGLISIISCGSGVAYGAFGKTPAIRFNSLGNYPAFKDKFTDYLTNRCVYSVAALLFFAAAVMLYDIRRRGMLNGNGICGKRHIHDKDTDESTF